MNTYRLSQGNPEGTDYSLSLIHNEKYSYEQFQDICESAIVETLKRQVENESKKEAFFIALAAIDTNILYDVLKAKGFIGEKITESYYLEPYWGKQGIKNKELLEWADGKVIDSDKTNTAPCQNGNTASA